jgi:hypothetical protein
MAYKKGSKEAMQNRQPLPPSAAPLTDLNDGKEWSEEDIRDRPHGSTEPIWRSSVDSFAARTGRRSATSAPS